ncbi:M50 family metallopeptidase [Sphingomonas glaciei]|uniref:M50 family metallopeptidase n=1 Tax=Sphingomonas glaciei TaxID=2938948 RepID=A0ABY5MRN1_9SPHN|nr:M50 family metallopeptidase [Sphingomonas glaciei]UUR07149.1 M50 family metallopeptidase [Sphingomonas glaciei]
MMMLIAFVSVTLWQTSLGRILLYPFTILATWFHEFGHGLAALLTGNAFHQLLIFPDGSGLAFAGGRTGANRLTQALIPAGGLFGPPIAGALLIIASRSREATQGGLNLLGILLIASTAIWVRTLVGWLILPAMGAIILVIAHRASPAVQRLAIQLLGVQAVISVWAQLDYLFMSEATVAGEVRRSDSAAIADALFAPYWFWGAAISVASFALLWWSLKVAMRR